MSSSSLRKGSRVAIFGLQGESSAALNGALGNVHAFDGQSCRWQVDIDCHGFKKVKDANLVALRENVRKPPVGSVMQKPMTIQRKTKLCRFGEACWRPNCHFAHEDERQRCTKLASLWDPDVLDDCQPRLASKQLDNDIVKLKTDISRHEAQINSSLRDLEELKDSLAVNCGGVCDPDSQLATGSVDGYPLSTNDLIADLDRRIFDLDQKLSGDLDKCVLGTLHAAVVPLAEQVSEKVLLLERRVGSLNKKEVDVTLNKSTWAKTTSIAVSLLSFLLLVIAFWCEFSTVLALSVLVPCMVGALFHIIGSADVFHPSWHVGDALPWRRPYRNG